jgi:hypothetical protein
LHKNVFLIFCSEQNVIIETLIIFDSDLTAPFLFYPRYVRVIDRKRRKVETGVAAALLELSTTDINKEDTDLETPKEDEATLDIQVNEAEADGSDEQDTGVHDENDSEMLMKMMRDEVQQLTTENMKLRDELQSFKFSEEVFENNEEKVRYFTGLPKYILLMGIFNIVEPYIVVTGKSVLSKFEQFVMVLMRLRLNLSVQDLAYRFRVSRATVSRVFNSVIHVMYMRMKNYIVWPEREELRRTMPMEFRKRFGVKVAIIIDCFEVFIERPSNLLARSQTWSNYKHNNTVKFLIGITPQGSVSFLSAAYGGRASDKFITEDCGILNALLPGDIVLADRGFNIAESVGLMCAEVKIPAFTRGKKQLSALEVENTRSIAHVRIHVERVIGLVRNKYTILQDKLPIDFLINESGSIPTIDKIAAVCCSLTNFCDSVVSFD